MEAFNFLTDCLDTIQPVPSVRLPVEISRDDLDVNSFHRLVSLSKST